jgi:hypothetical protein
MGKSPKLSSVMVAGCSCKNNIKILQARFKEIREIEINKLV